MSKSNNNLNYAHVELVETILIFKAYEPFDDLMMNGKAESDQ